MFNRALLGMILPVTLQASAATAAPSTLNCREERGGWCESDGACYANYKSPANFLIAGAIPDEMGTQKGLLAECREEKCGPNWDVELRRGMGNLMMVMRLSETFHIDLQTGFFAHSMISSAQTAGRVTYTFGRCERPVPR